eukprot:GEMP01029995.1.p1 GENE.GEMP01029995.1~~GEMP01029995.1.p1  ORF type:complete len:513 (+),score=127.92 GEMP01029995.1:64-1602(+)
MMVPKASASKPEAIKPKADNATRPLVKSQSVSKVARPKLGSTGVNPKGKAKAKWKASAKASAPAVIEKTCARCASAMLWQRMCLAFLARMQLRDLQRDAALEDAASCGDKARREYRDMVDDVSYKRSKAEERQRKLRRAIEGQLIDAAYNNDVGAIFESEAAIDCADCHGNTPLSAASNAGNVEAVKVLLSLKAYPNTTGEFHRTPLWRAAFHGYADVVEILLRGGADPTIFDNSCCQPINVASTPECQELIKTFGPEETNRLKTSHPTYIALEEEKEKQKENDWVKEESAELIAARKNFVTIRKSQSELFAEWLRGGAAQGEYNDAVNEEMTNAMVTLQDLLSSSALRAPKLWNLPLTRLSDVIIRDAEGMLKDKPWPLIWDESTRAGVFFEYSGSHYVRLWCYNDMKNLRKIVLSGLKYGIPVVLDTMFSPVGLDHLRAAMDIAHEKLYDLLMCKRILTEFMQLTFPEDKVGQWEFLPEYLEKFRFVVLTSSPMPSDDLLSTLLVLKIRG